MSRMGRDVVCDPAGDVVSDGVPITTPISTVAPWAPAAPSDPADGPPLKVAAIVPMIKEKEKDDV